MLGHRPTPDKQSFTKHKQLRASSFRPHTHWPEMCCFPLPPLSPPHFAFACQTSFKLSLCRLISGLYQKVYLKHDESRLKLSDGFKLLNNTTWRKIRYERYVAWCHTTVDAVGHVNKNRIQWFTNKRILYSQWDTEIFQPSKSELMLTLRWAVK